MAITDVELEEYTLIPFEQYNTLQDKLQALLNGEVLFIKNFERQEGADVLVRIVQKKFTVSQISYDVAGGEEGDDPRFWTTFNVGLNDLSLFTCFKFVEEVFNLENKYMINDTVHYTSVDSFNDSAIVEEVYRHKVDPTKFAYRLSRDGAVYGEDELVTNPYM